MINVAFEFLAPRHPQPRRALLFYGVIVLARRWSASGRGCGSPRCSAGTSRFGFARVRSPSARARRGRAATSSTADWVTGSIERWVLIPSGLRRSAKYAYVALVAAVALTQLTGWADARRLVPTLYLAAVVWENILVEQPAVTRLILLGALLVVLMNARPQGLLGTPRVEIV